MALAWGVAGCGSDSGTPFDEDAGGGTVDAYVPPARDAGTTPVDAHHLPDAGTVDARVVDAATLDAARPDGGSAAHDAGMAAMDASVAMDAGYDAALAFTDAGVDAEMYMCPEAPASGTWQTVTGGTPRPPLTGARVREFAFTGAMQSFVVPDGVRSLEIKVWGAGGGTSGGGTSGGGGGFVRVPALTVTPGETLDILVGGGGAANTGLAPGGFGGGGSVMNPSEWIWSGGGGGRSAILRGSEEIITAGGGGGSGYPILYSCASIPTPPAGAGCSNAGGVGGDGSWPGGGGGGGLQLGGAAGYASGSGATVGLMGAHFVGADGLPAYGTTSGGGGGGWFGGGSGAHLVHLVSGGGGGGSCHGPAGAIFEGGAIDKPGGFGDADYDGVAGLASHPTAAMPATVGGHGRVVIRW